LFSKNGSSGTVFWNSDDGAVLGRHVERVVGGAEPARRRHVLHHHGRLARDVLAEVARNGAAIGVVAAAGRGGDDQADLLAAVEIRGALRVGGCARCQQQQQRGGRRRRDRAHETSGDGRGIRPEG
jgi:hypothetical protein